MDARTEARLRRGFRRYLNPFMRLLWRLGLGPWFDVWPRVSGRVMVIVHTGRKSGQRRYAPVNYALVDSELYCAAGFGSISDWYRNVIANSNVDVWLPNGWWAGVAADVSDCETRVSLLRQVMIGSGVVAYLAGFDPLRMTDVELEAATAKYRLLHIRRTEARTGPGGPGDLAWVWPLASLILLPFALAQRRRKGS